MSLALRFLVVMLALAVRALAGARSAGAALERGTAIIDPGALRELDRGTIWPRPHAGTGARAALPLDNAQLFALPAMAPVKAGDRRRIRTLCRSGTRPSLPAESIGVGEGFDFQLFDRAQLTSPDTRFALAGIVNRMDRAYVDERAAAKSA